MSLTRVSLQMIGYPGTVSITTNTTLTNDMLVGSGQLITVATGVTLTINGSFSAGLYRVFFGDGTVVFGARTAVVHPEWFYDGSGNWASAINKAIQATAAQQEVKLPAGEVPIAGTGTEIILIDKMIKFTGHGVNGTKLILSIVSGAVGNSTPAIRVCPVMNAANGNGIGLYMADFTIQSLDGGTTKVGSYGIHLDTTVSNAQILAETIIERIWIYPMGGAGIYQSDYTGSIDGYFNSVIRNCMVFGGMTFTQLGDTNRIENNFMRGDGYGLLITMTDGSSILNITGNVITSAGGNRIIYAGSCLINGNQFERQVTNTNPNAALLEILGTGTPISMPVITNNKFYDSVNTNAIHVYLNNVLAPRLNGNYHSLEFSTTQCCYYITSNCKGADVRENFIIKDATPSYTLWRNMLDDQVTYPSIIQDSGLGTVGFVKTPTLQNSWTASGIAPTVERTDQEWVCFNGGLQPGTKTSGVTIFTIPAGFRPNSALNLYVNTTNSVSGVIAARLNITTAGVVTLNDFDTNILTVELYGVAFKSLNS